MQCFVLHSRCNTTRGLNAERDVQQTTDSCNSRAVKCLLLFIHSYYSSTIQMQPPQIILTHTRSGHKYIYNYSSPVMPQIGKTLLKTQYFLYICVQKLLQDLINTSNFLKKPHHPSWDCLVTLDTMFFSHSFSSVSRYFTF